MKEIGKRLGEKYRGVFVVSKEDIAAVEEELKEDLGGEFSKEALTCYIYEELSLGELTPLLMDDTLEEIMVVAKGEPVYIYRRHQGVEITDIYLEEEKVRKLVERIATYSGRKINSEQPLLDARLPDGSRVNATLSNVSPRGSTLTIRKFAGESLTIVDLIKHGTLTTYSAAFLWLAVEGMNYRPANCLIIGGTASGKTTTLNALSSFIPEGERTISIEDVLEVSLAHNHWIPLETRPPDVEGNEISMDDLLKNALRMRPDRIIVGEVRAEEALTLFTAMNTGHDGTLATLHANSAKETLSRLQSHPMKVPNMMIPALDFIIAQKRQVRKGKLERKIYEIVEISGSEGDNILTNTLFKFDNKKNAMEEVILGGSYMEELSTLTNMKISEVKEEIKVREALLKVMVDRDYNQEEIHKVVQLYYSEPDKAISQMTGKDEKKRKRGILDL